MDYNKELLKLEFERIKLMKEAKLKGYIKINEKYIKEDFVPVIEFYMNVKALHESTGTYLIIKNIVPISEEYFQIIKTSTTMDEIMDSLIYFRTTEQLLSLFEAFDYLGNYDFNEIFKTLSEKEALEFYWKLKNNSEFFGKELTMECESGEGYISIYKMPIQDFFKKEEDVYIKLKKYLRFN